MDEIKKNLFILFFGVKKISIIIIYDKFTSGTCVTLICNEIVCVFGATVCHYTCDCKCVHLWNSHLL